MRVPDCLHASPLHKLFNDSGRLCSLLNPLFRFFLIELDFGRVLQGIVCPEYFDKGTIPSCPRISYDDPVERSLMCSQTSKSDFDQTITSLKVNNCNIFTGIK